MSLLDEELTTSKKEISPDCRIDTNCDRLGINDNPELKAFITMQSFSVKRFSTSGGEIRGVSFDNSRGKWQARYKPQKETDLIKQFYHRYNSKAEAEKAMADYKNNLLHTLKDKYPDYFIRNTLERRIASGKANLEQKQLYNQIKNLTDDEIIDKLVRY